jgi:hypothetical protein
MKVQHVIYEDLVIAIGLVFGHGSGGNPNLAMRYLEPRPYVKDGKTVEVTNLMGGQTDWFILPQTLGAAVARNLIELKTAGLEGFNGDGYAAMVKWLVDDEELHDAMCY